MKIIFKTETEILREIELSEMTYEIQEELKESFDNKPILKYEIIFKEGVIVKQCHRLEDISDETVQTLTVTIA
jgi:hypothetical protein